MAFNRSILYVPTREARVARFDLFHPGSPVALPDLSYALDIEIVSLALFSDGDLVLLDRKNGRLIRSTPTGGVVWNVDCRDASEIPRQVMVDKNDTIWVGFESNKVAHFLGNGTLSIRIPLTDKAVLQGSDETFLVAYNDATGRVVLIDVVSETIVKEFTIAQLSPAHEPVRVKQIGMFESKFYIPVRRKANQTNPGLYEILKINEDQLTAVLPLQWPVALTGTLTDASGNIFVMDEFARIMRFLSNDTLFAVYSFESEGRLNGMALSQNGSILYVTSDDLFGEARVHAVDPLVGVPVKMAYDGHAHNSGDLTGFQRASVIADPDTPLLPPVVTPSLIEGFIHMDPSVGVIVTGKVGSVINAVSVSWAYGSAPVEADGSFALRTPSLAPTTETLTFVGPGGSTNVAVPIVMFPATVSSAEFLGTKFGLDGGFIKIKLRGPSGEPIMTGLHQIRILENNSGLWFNGTNLVATNGVWLSLTHTDHGVWVFHFIPPKAGDYTIFFNECPSSVGVYDEHQILVTDEKQKIDSILTKVNKLENPFGAPASLLRDPKEVGGFLADRLNRLQFLLNVLAHKAQLVFPRAVEGIAVQVSRTFIKANDTPLVFFTILDPVTGEPKDLTGHTVRWRARTQPGGLLIFDRELDLVDPKNGQAQVRLDPADTDTSGSFVSEVEAISPDQVILTTQTFNVTIQPDLT